MGRWFWEFFFFSDVQEIVGDFQEIVGDFREIVGDFWEIVGDLRKILQDFRKIRGRLSRMVYGVVVTTNHLIFIS